MKKNIERNVNEERADVKLSYLRTFEDDKGQNHLVFGLRYIDDDYKSLGFVENKYKIDEELAQNIDKLFVSDYNANQSFYENVKVVKAVLFKKDCEITTEMTLQTLDAIYERTKNQRSYLYWHPNFPHQPSN